MNAEFTVRALPPGQQTLGTVSGVRLQAHPSRLGLGAGDLNSAPHSCFCCNPFPYYAISPPHEQPLHIDGEAGEWKLESYPDMSQLRHIKKLVSVCLVKAWTASNCLADLDLANDRFQHRDARCS